MGFTATRTGSASAPLDVTVQATAPNQIGVPLHRLHRVTFEADSSTAGFSLRVPGYSNYRTDAVFEVEVVAGTNYQVPASATPIRIPIRDVDIPTVRIEPVLASVSESQQCAWFQLVHSNTDGFFGSDDHFVDVLIDVTTEGDFLAGAARQTVRMLGATDGPAKTVCVALDDDATVEAEGSVTATISLAAGGRFAQVASDGNAATVTVTDDDLPVVTLSTTATEVAEGDSVEFTVTRTGAADEAFAIMVDYGAGAADYTAHTVTFGAGAESGMLTLATVQDTELSFDRTLSVVLRDAATWRVDGQASSVALPIVDDDLAVASVSALSRSVTEGSGCAWFSLSVDNVTGLGASENAWVEVPLTITEQGSYLLGASTQTVRMEQSRSNVCVALDDDSVVETDGSVTATISPGAGAKVEAAIAFTAATVTVTDDDGTPPSTVAAATVAIVSDPGSDATYATGDEIELAATFSAVATVSGTPQLVLALGGGTSCDGGSGSTTLTFSYTVETGDVDGIGISVAANGLQANGGTLSLAGGATPRLTALTAQTGHKVDGVGPALEAWSDGQAGVAVVGEPLLLTMRFSEAVSALAVADFRVRNGTLSELLREPVAVDADPTWTVLVTPAAAGEVEVQLPAGVYEDAHGNTGTASPVYRKAVRKPVVTITAAEAEIEEGEVAQFTLSRDIGVEPMTVSVEVTGTMGATSTREVTFAERTGSEASTAMLRITTENDRVDEPDGTISVRVLDGTGYTAATPRTARTRVTDDDRPTVVSTWTTYQTRTEGQRIPFTVFRLGGSNARPLTVRLRVSITGDMFTGANSFGADLPHGGDVDLTLPAGSSLLNVYFDTDDDAVFEQPATITVEVLRPTNADYVTGTLSRDTAQVLDNDTAPLVYLSNSFRAGTIDDGETARFILARPSVDGELTVVIGVRLDQRFVPSTAMIAGQPVVDGALIRVTFPSSRSSLVLSVPTVDDATNEADGAITLFLVESSDHSYRLAQNASATVRVVNDPRPTVSLTAPAADITEGDTASFRFHRTGDSSVPFDVYVRVSGHRKVMANTTSALVPAAGTRDIRVAFTAGSVTTTLDLATQADQTNEGHGSLQVTLVDRSTYRILGQRSGKVLVRDNDAVTVTLEVEGVTTTLQGSTLVGTVADGGAIAVKAVCSLSDGGRFPYTFAIDAVHPDRDDSRQGTDFVDCSASTSLGVIGVGPDNGHLEVALAFWDDNSVEAGGEGCSSATSYLYCRRFTMGAARAARIDISNQQPVIAVEADDYSIESGSAARFKIRRIWTPGTLLPQGRATEVAYRITQSGGYTDTAGKSTVVFAAGETEKTLSISTWKLGVDDSDGTVAVEILDDPTPSAGFGGSYDVHDFLPGVTPTGRSAADLLSRLTNSSRRAAVNIRKSRVARIEIEDAGTAPEDGGKLSFTVTIWPPSANDLAVRLTTVDGTATAGEDYQPLDGQFVIPAQSGRFAFEVLAVDDSTYERKSESMKVRLTLVSGDAAFSQGATSIEAVGTIRDDDKGVVDMVARPDQVLEGVRARFKLTRTGYNGVELGVYLYWEAPEGGHEGPTSVTFPPGSSTQFLRVIVPDNDTASLKANRQYGELSITGMSSADYTWTDRIARVFVIDDEGPELAFVDYSPAAVTEGTEIQVAVELSERSAATVTVSVETVQLVATEGLLGTATSGSDFTPISQELTFSPGVTRQTVTIASLEDQVDEDVEQVGVRLSNARFAPIRTADDGSDPSRIKLSIGDNDPAPRAEIRRVGPAQFSEAGGKVEFVVSLDRPSERSPGLILEAKTSIDSIAQPIEDIDLQGVVSLRFSAVETAKTIEIAAVDDDVDEPDETLEMQILASGSTPVIVRQGLASAQIVDDDTRGITVAPTAISVPDGGSTSYSVVLESEPSFGTGSVQHVTVLPNAVTGLTISPRRLRFTPDDWQEPQSVRVASTLGSLAAGTTVNIAHQVRAGDYANFAMRNVAVTVLPADHPVISIANGKALESASAMAFSVALSGTLTDQVTVAYETLDRSAEAGADYVAVSGRLTFAADGSNRVQTIQVQIVDDSVDEGNTEKFGLKLFDPKNALLSGGTRRTAIGTIVDDEAPAFSIADARAREDAGSLAFEVSLSSPATESVSVHWTTTEDSALAGSDFRATSGTLTFDPGDVRANVAVVIVNDTTDEPAETFTVSLDQPTSPAVLGRATAIGTILPDDDFQPGFGLRIDESTASVVEGQTVTFTLERNRCNRCPVSGLQPLYHAIEISATGTFLAGTAATEVAFPAGAEVTTVVVETVDDWVDEVDGTVTLTIPDRSAKTGLRLLGAASHTAQITDNDTRGITITPTRLDVAEAAQGTYSVVLDSEPTAAVTVSPSLPPSAFITATPAGLTFDDENWDVAQSFTVAAMSDTDGEDEQIEVSHEVAGGDYESLAEPFLTVRVADPQTASTEIILSVVPTSVPEGGGAQQVVGTAKLDAAPRKQDTTVRISVVPAEAADTDLDGVVAPVDVVIEAGSTAGSATLTVTPAADHRDEAHENLVVEGRLVDVGTALSVTPATLTITDDDSRGVTVSQGSLAVAEGDTSNYTLVLESQPTGQVQIDVDIPSGTDVAVNPNRLVFTSDNWNTAQTVNVQVREDPDDVTDSAVVISHDVRATDYADVTVADVTVTITDTTTPTFNAQPVDVPESGSQLQFRVELNVSSAAPLVTLDYATEDDSAAAGQDYTGVTGTLTFAAATGESFPLVRTVTVPVVDDALDETDTETFTLVLQNPVGADLAAGSELRVVGTIVDDDLPPIVSAGVPNSQSTRDSTSLLVSTLGEAAGQIQFLVMLSEPSALEARVRYATTDAASSDLGVSATPTEDYAATSGVLTFAAGETSKTIRVTVVADAFDEPDEFFAFRVSDPHNAQLGRQLVVVEIEDDDTRGITLSEREAPVALVSVEEGNSKPIAAVLATQPTAQVTIRLELTGSTDVSVSPTSLTFSAAAWNQPQTITVTAASDGDPLAERASVGFSVAGGDYAALTVPDLPIAVTDDDDVSSVVHLEVTPDRISEGAGSGGAELVVTGTLDGATRVSKAKLTVWLEEESGRTRSNLGPVDPLQLTIPAGGLSSSTTFTITPIDNRERDGDRTVTLRGRTRARGLRVEVSDPTIRILDDDPEPLRFTVAENETAVGTVAVTNATAYTIEEGADGALFELNATSGAFAFTSAPNYEEPQDRASTDPRNAAGDNEYVVFVTVSVGSGGTAEINEHVAIVTVTDVGTEAPGVPDAPAVMAASATSFDVTWVAPINTGPEISDYDYRYRKDDPQAVWTEVTDTAIKTLTVTIASLDPDAEYDVQVRARNAEGTGEWSESGGGRTDKGAGLELSEAALAVTEGTSTTYTVALATQPTGEVTVAIGVTSGTDLSVDKSSLTFTTTDWGTAQAVEVTAGEDADSANNSATLTHTAAGADYGSVTADLPVTVTDNDTIGLALSATLAVTEGSSETYTVALATQPSGQVTVTIGGTGGTDLSVDKSSLTFTTTDWGTAQAVEVTAGEDPDAANDSATLTHTAAGADYGSVTADLAVTVTDDDAVALAIDPSTLTVSEAASATYTVALATEPSGPVTVTIGGTSGTDLRVDKSSLTFTTTDWSTAQAVEVTAGDDPDAANDSATLTHAAAGADYGAVSKDLAVTVVDDETAGLELSEESLTVAEGGSVTYTVALATQPTGQVTVTVGGTANTDLSVDESSLTFSASDWSTAQTVEVTAGDDPDATNDSATLTHTAAGADYGSVSEDLAVTVTDDDMVGLELSETALIVAEGGGATYAVALATEPSGQVTVTVGGTANTDLSVDESRLTFSASDWGTAQTVEVTAGDDPDATNDSATLTHTAAGADYWSVSEDLAVTVTVTDDDTVGLELSETALTVAEGGSATYTVALATQPSGRVTVTIRGATGTHLRLDKGTLTFRTSDWGTAQTVEVTAGQDADAANGSATLTHTAAGADYDSVSKELPVTVTDDDTVDLELSETALTVAEGGSATYAVALATQPSGQVTVTIGGTSGTDLGVDLSTLTFTPSDWDTAQAVEVTAGEDPDAANDSATLTHTASGADYGSASKELPVTVIDNDSAGLELSEESLAVTEGGSATYTVALATQPSARVAVTIGGTSGTDLSVDNAVLIFTPSTWSTAQTVEVTAGEDPDAVNDRATVTHTAVGGDYTAVTASLAVRVTDNESPGLAMSAVTLVLAEGGRATYAVALATEPSGQVTVTVGGTANTDLSVDESTLTFTTSDWETAQTVTVTAAEDFDGGNDSATLTHTAAGADYGSVTEALAVWVIPE